MRLHLAGHYARRERRVHRHHPRVQGEVDEARSLMHGTLESMLQNQEQLTSLQGKTDAIAGASKGLALF